MAAHPYTTLQSIPVTVFGASVYAGASSNGSGRASIFLLDAGPVDEFHGDEAVFFIDFVDGTDIGVIERCSGSGFAEESLTVFRSLRR